MFKSPMLAKDYDESTLSFPRYASPKLDGWRAVIHAGVVTTRSGKAVRNKHIQNLFGRIGLEGLDGELVVGGMSDQLTFNRTDSGCKKEAGEPDATFYVFDHYDMPHASYCERLAAAREQVKQFYNFHHGDLLYAPKVVVLEQTLINSLDALDNFESECLDAGFEGVMLRDLNGGYKYGRSTVREGLLLKVKRFSHDEAVIIGTQEQMSNGNEAFTDELGRTKRTSHKENKTPTGMIGAYICKNEVLWPGQTFNVSCGSMSHEEKVRRWVERDNVFGQTIRFKHLPHGAKDAPRHGLFDGFRSSEDASALA